MRQLSLTMAVLIGALHFTATPAHAFGLCWPECVESLPLAPDAVLVTARGTGWFANGQNANLLIEAARQTIANGYSHFYLTNARDYQQYAGGSYHGYRSGGWIGGNYNSVSHGTASAIVHMGDHGLDAALVLRKYGE